ncbi:response regulator, partial [Mesorhizobium sp. M4B.F.Ca.ET.190.01.1.1]|uniref:response regulator n=1 Tax=Mesorhizobium sp. M4B.F.Ca.ET.190.01.1.1 TaxID=2563951 RepID=UPI001FDF3AFE
DLFRSMKFDPEAFDSATVFLEKANLNRPRCLLLDVRLPGISGLDFQMQLERVGNRMPIIFMTGFGDIPMSVRAMKAGAVDFLTKGFYARRIFLGAQGVGALGIMESDALVIQSEQKLMRQAEELIVMVDSS